MVLKDDIKTSPSLFQERVRGGDKKKVTPFKKVVFQVLQGRKTAIPNENIIKWLERFQIMCSRKERIGHKDLRFARNTEAPLASRR